MLGDRSINTIVVSGRLPALRPSQPPSKGRLTAKISPAIASILMAMIRYCRRRAYPRDILLAASRNIIAAQRMVW